MFVVYMLIAGVGGFVGTCGRYLTGVASKKIFGDGFPAGTFIVNVVGCFIIGIFYGILRHHGMSELVNQLLITGFCGGFTTFSSFAHDQYALLQKGAYGKFIIYLCFSVILGLAAVYLGMLCI